MTLSVRLDSTLERELDLEARQKRVPKSEVVRLSLIEHFQTRGRRSTPWELGKEVFGRVGSGRGDLASNRKQIVREKLHGRNRHR